MAPRGAAAEDAYELLYGDCGQHKTSHFFFLLALCIGAQRFHLVVYWFDQPESDLFFQQDQRVVAAFVKPAMCNVAL